MKLSKTTKNLLLKLVNTSSPPTWSTAVLVCSRVRRNLYERLKIVQPDSMQPSAKWASCSNGWTAQQKNLKKSLSNMNFPTKPLATYLTSLTPLKKSWNSATWPKEFKKKSWKWTKINKNCCKICKKRWRRAKCGREANWLSWTRFGRFWKLQKKSTVSWWTK